MLLVLPVLIAACGEDEKPPIKFADNQIGGSLHVGIGVARFILENGYGYPTESIEMSTPVFQATLASGDSHVQMEGWQQNMPQWYEEEIAAGTIKNLGMNLEGGPQFFTIPQWVHEQYGINTVEDMKDNWELFKDPEDPGKGAFYNCIIGWQCGEINPVKLEAYGLDKYYNIISPGSGAALAAALAGPQKKNKAVFGYYWAPTALMGLYDFYILEEPAYNAACWEKVAAAANDESLRPVSQACAYQDLPLDILIWSDLEDIAPDAVEFLDKMSAGLEQVNKTLAWADVNEVEDLMGEGAIYYLKTFEDKWSSWLPADEVKKVKEALAEVR